MKRYFVSDVTSFIDYTGNIVNRHLEFFLIKYGYQPFYYKWKNKNQKFYVLIRLLQVILWSIYIRKNSIVIFHFPIISRVSLFLLRLLNRKKVITVALIHDFNGLRFGNNNVFENEKKCINKFAHVIVHNSEMQKMVSTFYNIDQISILWLFDYYSSSTSFLQRRYSLECSIAANIEKAIYLKENIQDIFAKNKLIKIHLYGHIPPSCYKAISSNNILSHGPVHPDELPSLIEGAFGLVWDGDSIATCSGSLGKYLKYNTPHKLSLYLAAGLPVIVWAESAMADWVVINQVGITIHNWEELNIKLGSINTEYYNILQTNAQNIGILLRNGEFIKKTISIIENKFN